jgi:hypothetical protein
LARTVEVTLFDLRPFAEVAWTLEDGTKVWIVEALATAAVRLGLAVVGVGRASGFALA